MLYQIYNHSPSAQVCISDTTRPLMLYILLILYGYKLDPLSLVFIPDSFSHKRISDELPFSRRSIR